MSQSEQINELSAALSKAQGAMEAAVYNKTNPHFKSKYADLAAVWDAIRKPLSSHGLSVTQTTEYTNGSDPGFVLVTTLRHSSGQWLSSVYPLPQGVQPQALGSALTYARRYSLSAIVGIAADEDDDANEAQAAHKPPSKAAAAVIQAAKQELPDPGPAREIPLGDTPDWVRFGQLMIQCADRFDGADWDEANRANMERMEQEAPKVYARMVAAIRKADAHPR